MTDAADQVARSEQLRTELRRLAAEVAGTAEHAARVHDALADTAQELGDGTRLDADRLHDEADRARAFAARERQAAQDPSGQLPEPDDAGAPSRSTRSSSSDMSDGDS